jgi:predicted alpha/beta-fold hydrolase
MVKGQRMTATQYEFTIPFKPARFAKGPHSQMIIAHALEHRKEPDGGVVLEVPLNDGDRLTIVENQPKTSPLGGVLLLHGLGGSSLAKYMISAAHRLLDAGYTVFRMNYRGAGQGALLSKRMYNAGLGCDIAEALRFLSSRCPGMGFVPVGFSMSGNTLLKFLAENDDSSLPINGALAVNPAADLSRCMKAIESPENFFYHRRFTKLLVNQRILNEPAEGRPQLVRTLAKVRSIRTFDETVTAPAWGFKDPEEYYQSQSALPLLGSISRPTVIVTSDDDPLIPVDIFKRAVFSKTTSLHIAGGGGHMGYLAEETTLPGDRRWQDYMVAEAVERLFTD